MKKMKKNLILLFCFVLTLTLTDIPSNYDINPLGHMDKDTNSF